MKRGVLLFAHGARDPRWAEPFEAIAARVRAASGAADANELAVELGYLELMTPSLRDAALRLLDAGCSQVDIVPLFLGAGGHVRRDLPLLVAALRAEFAGASWVLQAPIGEAPAVIDAIAGAALDMILAARPHPTRPDE